VKLAELWAVECKSDGGNEFTMTAEGITKAGSVVEVSMVLDHWNVAYISDAVHKHIDSRDKVTEAFRDALALGTER
jgi:hypothetical protein